MPAHHPPWLQRTWAHTLLLCAATIAAYAGVAHLGFAFDDHALVLFNPAIQQLGSDWSFLTQDLWAQAAEGADSGYYRPLVSLDLAIDWAIAGQAPAVYHLHNLAWHLLAVLLVHRLLTGLTGALPAVAGATLFALHPLQSEAVAWVAARNDLMVAALLAATLLALHDDQIRRGRIALGGVLALATMFSKESALLLPLFLLALDLARHGRPRRWQRHAVLWGAAALYLAARAAVGVNPGAAPPTHGWQLLGQRLPDLLALAATSLAWPWPLSVGRDLNSWSLGTPSLLLGLLIAAAILAGLLASRERLVMAGLAWCALAFAPVLAALADKALMGERYFYLPMLGMALALAAALQVIPTARRPLIALGLVVALPWMMIIRARVPDWTDNISLWRATVRHTPSTYAYGGLGSVLDLDGHRDEALDLLLLSLSGPSPKLEVCPKLAKVASRMEDHQRALEGSQRALGLGCTEPAFVARHAQLLAWNGHWDDAGAAATQAGEHGGGALAQHILIAAVVTRQDCGLLQGLDPAQLASPPVLTALERGGHPELAQQIRSGTLCTER
jgi:hypothetical protein